VFRSGYRDTDKKGGAGQHNWGQPSIDDAEVDSTFHDPTKQPEDRKVQVGVMRIAAVVCSSNIFRSWTRKHSRPPKKHPIKWIKSHNKFHLLA
jgi:hypothetical protein